MDRTDQSPEWGDDVTNENIETVDKLIGEYRSHMGRQIGRVARRKPIEEVTNEFRGVLSWLMVEDIEAATDSSIKKSNELYLDYSAYDVEDTFFIVYEQLNGRRGVRVEDIVREHEETNLKAWQEAQTKKAADFLILHGANETEVNEWKSVEGTGRQQRAMRRMYWLLQQPYMQRFKEFLKQRATTESPFSFSSLATTVRNIILEGQSHVSLQQQQRHELIPRKQEELDETVQWLQLAKNICDNVFDVDIADKVYAVKGKNPQ